MTILSRKRHTSSRFLPRSRTPWVVAQRDGPWKLLANAELDKFELYNIVDDVGEKKNLADKQPERIKAMTATRKRLHADILADGAKSGNPAPCQPEK